MPWKYPLTLTRMLALVLHKERSNCPSGIDSRGKVCATLLDSPSTIHLANIELAQDRNAVLRSHNQRWAQASSDLSRPQTRAASSELNTPSTDRSSQMSDEARCVCGANEADGTDMIQCESCMKWLHIKCIGLRAHQLPPVYVCIFCTGDTPAVRGGRVREHLRGAPTYNSPLTHKSTYRR